MPRIWIGPKTWSAATGLLGGAKHLDFHTKRLLQKHGSPFARGCFLPGQMFAKKQFGDAGTENGHAPEPCNQKPMANGLQLPWAAWSGQERFQFETALGLRRHPEANVRPAVRQI